METYFWVLSCLHIKWCVFLSVQLILFSEHFNGAFSGNPFPWKTETDFSHTVDAMAADDLAMQGAKASLAILLTFSHYVPLSATKDLTHCGLVTPYDDRDLGHQVMACCLMTPSHHLAPVPLSIFRSNSKFDENSERYSFEYTRPITTIFCTRHDSDTVVTCAKYRCDRPRIFYTRVFWIFHRISNWIEICLVGRAPEPMFTNHQLGPVTIT